MPLPVSLGLLPELWEIIFVKSRRLALWDARVTQMDGLLSRSWARWKPSFWALDGEEEPDIYIGQRSIVFACRFKLMELTKLRDEEETDVSVYVYDLGTNNYVYMDDLGLEMLFEDYDDEDDEFEVEIQDVV